MGSCPCFGRSRRKGKGKGMGEKLRNGDAADLHKKPSSVRDSSESRAESSPSEEEPHAGNQAQIFTYRQLAAVTKNFRDEAFIGQGGFGAVFKGTLKTGQVVAVKKLDQTGLQGEKEFLVEVLMLSLLRDPHLVNLIGYCAEGVQRLLVYEYLPMGSLESHLHDTLPGKQPLDWTTRMKIASGAAKGLNYLHHEANPAVIYRDLKSSNILLDEGFHPKLSDFGLAKFGPTGDQSHVSTRVMGTHGYCAPEYAKSGKLTMKSDIYSFGVVLLELITGRRALDVKRNGQEKHLVDWVRSMLRDKKNMKQIADPRLQGNYSESIVKKAIDVATMCIREDPSTRPTITEVMQALDFLALRSNVLNELNRQSMVEPENDESPRETSRMLDKDLREQAVAEAKLWGETWREKRRQSAETSHEDLNR